MFERRSMEEILNKMIRWTRGSTTKLTDFRVGSKIRTIYEAVAISVEELYDKMDTALRQLIGDGIYAIFGFDRTPATYASGYVTMSKTEPSESITFIAAGTVVLSKATQYRAPVQYRTVEDAIIPVDRLSVDVLVVASLEGVDGNAEANTITDFQVKPRGVDYVTNPHAFTNGQDEETSEAQKARFNRYIQANSRGVLHSVEYGATTVALTDSYGLVTERVMQAKAFEYLPQRKGEIDLYIWNGYGTASPALMEEAHKIIRGYYLEDGTAVYGYKAGGIITNIMSAPIRYIRLKVDAVYEEYADEEQMKASIEELIDAYFSNYQLGTTFVQTALEADIKYIDGVYDVKLYVSVDEGETYTTENVIPVEYEVVYPEKPLIFVEEEASTL